MKNIVKVLSIAILGATLASCADKPEFTTAPFVSLYRTSATVNEKAGGTVYNVPVKVYHAKEAVSVAYTLSGTAVNGVDYTIADQSGVLNFPVGTDSLAIPINITGQPGTFTGDRSLRITLSSSTGGAEINPVKNFNITIKDLDHPLSALFGSYSISTYNVDNFDDEDNPIYAYLTWTMNMSEYKGDPTRVWMDNLTYFSIYYHNYTGDTPVYGIVSSDKKTITIPLPQTTTGNLSAWGLGKATMYGHAGIDGNYISDPFEVVFTLGEDGTWSTKQSFGISEETIVDAYSLFTYNCVNYADAGANYPIVFKKK